MDTQDTKNLEKLLMQFVADIAGSQRQIDLDLVTSLSINPKFLKSVQSVRKDLFKKLFKENLSEENNSYDFGYSEEIAKDEYNTGEIPEDLRTPLNSPTKRVMREFSLPSHFYLWTLAWLDKGYKPKYPPPVIDLDILVKSKEYLNTESGLPTDTKKKLKRLFSYYANSSKKLEGVKGAKRNIHTFFKKIPKNIHRQKPILKETLELLEGKKSSYSDIAFSKVFDKTGDFSKENELETKRFANKLRKRKSHYFGKNDKS